MLLGGGQDRKAILRLAGSPKRPIEALEEAAANLVLLQHDGHSLGLIDSGLSGAAAFRIGRKRGFEFVGQSQIIHYQAAGLVLEDAVDPGDCLHEPMPAHRLINIHLCASTVLTRFCSTLRMKIARSRDFSPRL